MGARRCKVKTILVSMTGFLVGVFFATALPFTTEAKAKDCFIDPDKQTLEQVAKCMREQDELNRLQNEQKKQGQAIEELQRRQPC